MDRSSLSDAAVIAASRKFVCVRLATYEDADEGTLLASLFRTRSGELENTVFAILSSDGKRKLTRAGRSPHMIWGGPPGDSARQMAAAMHDIAEKHPGRKGVSSDGAALPIAKDVRRGLNVAACDNLPFVVAVASKTKQLDRLEKTLAGVAWREAFLGRYVYAVTTDRRALANVKDVKPADGYVVVQPGRFGQSGTVLLQLPAAAGAETIAAGLERSSAKYRGEDKDHHRHVREGRRTGVHWETEIPVTDPGIPPGGGHRKGPPR